MQYLKESGASIDRLVFSGESFSATELAEISEHIVRYCGETLTWLELVEAGDALLTASAENQFPKLVHLELKYDDLPDSSQIHQIYPALEHLSFAPSAEDGQFVEHPNLQRITAALPSLPTLRALTVGWVSNALLSDIQARLPNLDALNVVYDAQQSNDRPVHFASLRNFSVSILPVFETDRNQPSAVQVATSKSLPLTAERLESVTVSAVFVDDALIDWLAQMPTLTTVALKFSFDHESLVRIGRALDGMGTVEQVILRGAGGLTVADLLPYFKRVPKVTFCATGLFKDTYDWADVDDVPNEWETVDDWDDTEMSPCVTAIRREGATGNGGDGDGEHKEL